MIDPEGWDWQEQRETAARVVRDIGTRVRLGAGQPISITFRFVPVLEQSDPAGLIAAFREAGYPSDVREADANRARAVVAIADATFGLDPIWAEESRVTRIALRFGFEPDGWRLVG